MAKLFDLSGKHDTQQLVVLFTGDAPLRAVYCLPVTDLNSVEAIGRYDRYMLRSFDCRNERVHSGFIRDDLLCELL